MDERGHDGPVLSRHRLPRRYRLGLTALWLLPIGLLILAVVLSRGLLPALLDPRFVLPLLLMGLPALYVWQEGIDVLPNGLVARLFWPRYYPYSRLETWYLDSRPGRRVLTIWDRENRKVLEARPGHLTELPALLAALKDNLRYRHWPY